MDIVAQILLNTTILLFGLVLLLPFLSKMNPLLYVSISWFTGWGVAGVIEIILVIAGIFVTRNKIALMSLLILMLIFIYYKYQGLKFSKDIKKYRILIFIFFNAVIAFWLLGDLANYIYYTADSLHNESLSRIFHFYGVFADGSHRVYQWLFNVRLPFYLAIHNIAYLSGIQVFYSFLSSTTIMILLMIIGFWIEGEKMPGCYTLLCLFTILCLFVTNKLIILHSFYHLSYLTNMAYYSAGIFCLNHFRAKRESVWFSIGCLFLGITCIIRKEMLIFSLLPFLLVFKDSKPDLKMLFKCFVIYTITAYSWFFWGMFGLKDGLQVFKNAFKTTGHGSIEIAGICFVASVLAFFLSPKIINNRKISSYYITPIAVITVIVILYLKGSAVAVSSRNLISLMFTNQGQWGLFWWIFLSFSIGIVVVGIIFKINKNYQNTSLDCYFPGIILSFFILRILLYAVFTSPADSNWNNSGNRMLVHIMPVCVFWMGQEARDLSENKLLNFEQNKTAFRTVQGTQ